MTAAIYLCAKDTVSGCPITNSTSTEFRYAHVASQMVGLRSAHWASRAGLHHMALHASAFFRSS